MRAYNPIKIKEILRAEKENRLGREHIFSAGWYVERFQARLEQGYQKEGRRQTYYLTRDVFLYLLRESSCFYNANRAFWEMY